MAVRGKSEQAAAVLAPMAAIPTTPANVGVAGPITQASHAPLDIDWPF